MSSPTSAPTIQACRNCGAGASLDAHVCPQCTRILPLPRQVDYFSFLGVPRALTLDADDLERRFRALSRQFHPDYFYNATPAERLASLERSSYLNDAYRTLRQPISRIEYLLKIEGLADAAGSPMSNAVPPALLEEVFSLNEELDEVRNLREGGAPADVWKGRLERARQPIEAKRAEHEAQLQDLAARWDAGGGPDVLKALRDQFLERNYINNLLGGIERELNS